MFWQSESRVKFQASVKIVFYLIAAIRNDSKHFFLKYIFDTLINNVNNRH